MKTNTRFRPQTFAVHPDWVETAAKLAQAMHDRRFRAGDYDEDDEDEDDIPHGPDGDRDDDTAEELSEMLWKSGIEAGSIAIIPVKGVLMRGCAGYEEWGLCDYETVLDAVQAAEDDANIKRIVLVVDSPGGGVMGCPEAAEAIAGVTKPLLVFTSGLLCSAAYWLTASADMIVATQSSAVGSIGCYRPFWDVSEAYGQMGVKVQLFASGAQKGAGYPGTSLSPEQSALIQSEVDDIAADFQNHVLTYRPTLDVSLFDGRDVRGKDGEPLGLVDAVVNDFSEAMTLFVAAF